MQHPALLNLTYHLLSAVFICIHCAVNTFIMFSYIFIVILLLESVSSQINGEFWWLHDKASELRQLEAPPPKFDDIKEFDTDESAKVVFKDNDLNSKEISKHEKNKEMSMNQGKSQSIIYFQDRSELSKPAFIEENTFNSKTKNNITFLQENGENIFKSLSTKKSYELTNKSQNDGDEFVFIFPISNEILWEDGKKNFSSSSPIDSDMTKPNNILKKPNIIVNNKVWFEEETKLSESESICTFITKQECIRNNGTIHTPGSFHRNSIFNTHKLCCILPLTSNISTKTRQSNNYNKLKRYRRSNAIENFNAALKQRNALLERRQNTLKAQTPKLTVTTMRSKPINKIVTPEYVDPYWNVKNSKFRNPGLQSNMYTDYQNTKYDYGNSEYVDDYAVELPKPGLVGLYSDREDSRGQTSWKIKNMNKGIYYGATDSVSEEDDGEGDLPFGYSTFDPRLGDRVSTDNPRRVNRKPQRVILSTEDDNDSESQTINFHATPDFHVLHGFKLINLGKNTNRYVRKTTEQLYDKDDDTTSSFELTTSMTADSNEDYIDGIDLSQQIYKKCGKAIKKPVFDMNFDKYIAEGGCDPWLAFVVLTKRTQSILCYATIIHQRAAITAADCVHGKSPGEITTISGVWDLKANREASQTRMSTVYTHLFKPGELDNNIALLHWKRPLKIEPNVQPACLSDPHVGDDCYFVGWGGYDQALQPQPRRQHATTLTPQNCNQKLSAPDVDIPTGAFCASVKTRGTVTGIGGPLLCKNNDRISIVGVAVYREDIVVLLPTFDWIIKALQELRIN
ncbi:uncharacterized protein LOC124535939 [Vanessa cardui]|uniref:uncharacterized protein LOC124535939 n=1 Tax=Vanessa cardui TaxID=171605 RepID=UPI001F132B7A|nr:uncharacterized protein LOC124535939 [Vanessa cardui]